MKITASALCLMFLVLSTSLQSQERDAWQDGVEMNNTDDSSELWYAGVATATVAGILFLDEPINEWTRKNRADRVSDIFRPLGENKIQISSILGITLFGLVTDKHSTTQLGIDMAKSLAATGALTYLGKRLFGRHRPNRGQGPHRFQPLASEHLSLPSGHTSSIFTVTTPIVEFLKPKMPDVLAYSPYLLAGMTGWSRMNDEKHWFSDVVLGAAVGIAVSKFTTENIKIFHLTPSIRASLEKVEMDFSLKF